MRWHNPGMSITIRNSNMAAAKLEIAKFSFKMKIKTVVSPLIDEISTKFQRRYQALGPAFHSNRWECCVTKPEGEKLKIAASKLQIHFSPLPDKISTKFQRLHLCLRGPAFHWDSWEYYATKQEVEKSKMAASNFQIHSSPLSDKISTKFQRLYLHFRGPAFHWDS